MVTKLDLERAVGRVQAGIGQVKADLTTEIGRVETDFKAEIGRVETGFKAEIVRVETYFKAEIASLKADLKLMKFAYGPAILGLLIKLVFFP